MKLLIDVVLCVVWSPKNSMFMTLPIISVITHGHSAKPRILQSVTSPITSFSSGLEIGLRQASALCFVDALSFGCAFRDFAVNQKAK